MGSWGRSSSETISYGGKVDSSFIDTMEEKGGPRRSSIETMEEAGA